MRDSLRHSLRLIHVARTLARHDALFTLEFMKNAPPALLLARRIANISLPFRAEAEVLRPGQKLAHAFESLGPGFIKLGQSMATRPDLIGEQMAEDLTALQDRLPPFAGAEARKIIEAELGKPIDEIFESFDDKAVAAASIAQVHFAVTTDGREVAVKVLRPNIEAAFARDLDMFAWAAKLIERAEPKSRRLRPGDVVATLARSVALEMDLRHEAAAASELKENMKSNPDYEVPAVDWERTGTRVLTLERVSGISFSDSEGLDRVHADRKALAEKLVTAFLTQALYHGFFHADLHQGNLFRGEHGQIIAVDFGIMGRLDQKTRHTLAEILYGFITRDYDSLAEAHFKAGYVPESESRQEFAQALRAIGEPIAGKPIKDVSLGKLLAQLLETTATFSMQTQPQLLLLQKTMVMAEGVALNIDMDVNMWEISRPVIEGWMKENLGPAAQARTLAKDLFQTLRRLPAMFERFEKAMDETSSEGLRLHPDTVKALADKSHFKDNNNPIASPFLWALLGGVLGAMITLFLMVL
jgi:ubiquinone biosynthesis protein